MSAHGWTPGPWKATKDPAGRPGDYCIGIAADDSRIDQVAVCSECDAFLIAQAPAMYEALEAMVKRFGLSHGLGGGDELLPANRQNKTVQEAMEVLAAAKGDSRA